MHPTTCLEPTPLAPTAVQTEPSPNIRTWIDHYPSALDPYWLEVRSIHAWAINPFTSKPQRTSRYFRIADLRRRP